MFSSPTSTEQDCLIESWSWTFGTGSPVSAVKDPLHTFTYSGSSATTTFTVTLTVSSGGGSHQATQVITVGSDGPICQLPVDSFMAVPASGKSPLLVQFTYTSTARIARPTWSWVWGDGLANGTTQNRRTFTNGTGQSGTPRISR